MQMQLMSEVRPKSEKCSAADEGPSGGETPAELWSNTRMVS